MIGQVSTADCYRFIVNIDNQQPVVLHHGPLRGLLDGERGCAGLFPNNR
jgi:hypothetical protein